MKSDQQHAAIQALGKVENIKNRIESIVDALNSVPLWQPAIGLKKECSEVLKMIESLQERFEKKLVITILGPCGSGKSTLLSALSGVDGLSEIGNDRPTTTCPVILAQHRSDAAQLTRLLGPDKVTIKSTQAAQLENVLLIDTPDTDSMEMEKHIPIVHRAIELSDMLICLFDSENPKRRDYVDFLVPYVKRFNGESIVCAINKCDRQDRSELENVILPEFRHYIRSAWDVYIERIFCISARSGLQNPGWDVKAPPRHQFNEFDDLKQMIFGDFNRPGFIIDKRLENVINFYRFLQDEIRRQIEGDREKLTAARKQIRDAQKAALNDSLFSVMGEFPRHQVGIYAILYQRLSQRWMGPVGWLVALWARMLMFGTGVAAALKFGNPVRQFLGVASSLVHYKSTQAAVSEARDERTAGMALESFRLGMLRFWPSIAELLVKARFDPSVRRVEDVLPESSTLGDEMSGIWQQSLDTAVNRAASQLSSLLIQFFFNTPVLIVLGYVGWITTTSFFKSNYLTSDFFLHSFLTIVTVLFFSFFIYQICIRLSARPQRITQIAIEKLKEQVEKFPTESFNPVQRQIDIILKLTSEN